MTLINSLGVIGLYGVISRGRWIHEYLQGVLEGDMERDTWLNRSILGILNAHMVLHVCLGII
jgi:hypothetical protein